MKSRFYIVSGCTFLLVAFLAAAPAMAGARFLSVIDDLPLMSGLVEVAGGSMVFDSPSGRIVEALTIGQVVKKAVLAFYSETLPQLGWLEKAPGKFSREGELLKLEFPPTNTTSGADGTQIAVLFMLSPEK